MSTLQELLAQKGALQRQQEEIARSIAEFQAAQRASVINEIKSLMAQHGLTASDLAAPSKRSSSGTTAEKEPSKVAIKYRDPESGSTWTGRGLKPRWLVAAIESGRSLDDFLVSNAQ